MEPPDLDARAQCEPGFHQSPVQRLKLEPKFKNSFKDVFEDDVED